MIYSKSKNYTLYLGKMEDELSNIDDNSIGSIVTDPPYELGFMGKSWDSSGVAFQKSTWEHCYRVLKPGGYLLAFGGSRTYHRIACAIEDAGFEIRDTIMWLYGSGFPKSMALDKSLEAKLTTGNANKTEFHKLNGKQEDKHHYGFTTSNKEQGFRPKDYTTEGVSNQYLKELDATTDLAKKYSGWGTALKPSFEPIIVARKPFKGSLVDNVIEYGVGGINIDECRVPFEDTPNPATNPLYRLNGGYKTTAKSYDAELSVVNFGTSRNEVSQLGRFPANTILTYDGSDYDEVCGGFPDTGSGGSGEKSIASGLNGKVYMGGWSHNKAGEHFGGLGDEGSASRYFYCAKASKKDRDEGLDEFETKQCVGGGGGIGNYLEDVNSASGKFGSEKAPHKNTHPTVKPTELMQYLIRLVTPKGETVLDPFMGSGSTGKAVMFENNERNANYKFIGVEMTEEYLPICEKRIEFAQGYVSIDEIDDKKVDKKVEKTPTCVKESLW